MDSRMKRHTQRMMQWRQENFFERQVYQQNYTEIFCNLYSSSPSLLQESSSQVLNVKECMPAEKLYPESSISCVSIIKWASKTIKSKSFKGIFYTSKGRADNATNPASRGCSIVTIRDVWPLMKSGWQFTFTLIVSRAFLHPIEVPWKTQWSNSWFWHYLSIHLFQIIGHPLVKEKSSSNRIPLLALDFEIAWDHGCTNVLPVKAVQTSCINFSRPYITCLCSHMTYILGQSSWEVY